MRFGSRTGRFASGNGIVMLHGLCRVPTLQDFAAVPCDTATVHPVISCPSDLLDARNIWWCPRRLLGSRMQCASTSSATQTRTARNFAACAGSFIRSNWPRLRPRCASVRHRRAARHFSSLAASRAWSRTGSICALGSGPAAPSALALRPAVLAFFRLRFVLFLLCWHAEEDFWQELGQQFNVPYPLRHQLATRAVT